MASEDQYNDTGTTDHQWPANFKLAAKEHCARLPLPAWGDWAHIAGFPQDPSQRLAFVDKYISTKLEPVDMRTTEQVARNLRPRIRGDLNKYRGWLLTQVVAQLHAHATTMPSRRGTTVSLHDGEAYLFPEDLPKAIDDLFLHHKFIGSSIQSYPNTVALRDATQPFAPAYFFGPDAQRTAHKVFLAEEGGNGQAFRLANLDDGIEIILPLSKAASMAYGSPRWCTTWKDSQYFENYLADGLLYIVTTPQGTRFQAHFESDQFRDAHDKQIGLEQFPTSSVDFLSNQSMLAAAIGRLIDTDTLNKTRIMHLLLHWGASNGHFSIVKQLIEKNAALVVSNGKGTTALHSAARHGHSDIAKLLVEYGASINALNGAGNTALHLATRHGHNDIAKLLIGMGASVKVLNGTGNTALHLAAIYGITDITPLLIENGASINALNGAGNTALHLSALYGSTAIAKLLIERGASIKVCDGAGNTALHLAARFGHTTVAQLLIENGAVLDTPDKAGNTALHQAAMIGHTDIAQLLIDSGAVLDAQDKAGNTSLHQAALYGRTDSARLLIESGAVLAVANRDGDTALHLSSRNGRHEIAKLLVEKGAALDAPDKAGALHQPARSGGTDLRGRLLRRVQRSIHGISSAILP